jgi:hypothetical protein
MTRFATRVRELFPNCPYKYLKEQDDPRLSEIVHRLEEIFLSRKL